MNIFGRIWAWLTRAEKHFELEFADITKSFTNTVARLEMAAANEWDKVYRHQATIDTATEAKRVAKLNAKTATAVAENVSAIFAPTIASDDTTPEAPPSA